MALAAQLRNEGYALTTVESAGERFSSIEFIMRVLMDVANAEGLDFTLKQLPIEECVFSNQFYFDFSINVMEHLADPYNAALNLCNYLAPNAKYRFFCPNTISRMSLILENFYTKGKMALSSFRNRVLSVN